MTTSQKIRSLLKRLAIFVALVVVVLGGAWLWQWSSLNKQLADLRAAGYPTSLAELNDYYKLPPGEADITADWVAVLQKIEAHPGSGKISDLPFVKDSSKLAPGNPDFEESLKNAELLLAYWDTELTELQRVAELPGAVRWPIDLNRGIQADLPHVRTLRTASQLLRVQAQWHAAEGNGAGFSRTLRMMFREAEVVQEPLVISQLVAVALFSVSGESLAGSLHRLDCTDDDLQSLHAKLSKFDFRSRLQHGLIGDRALMLGEVNRLPIGPLKPANRAFCATLFARILDSLKDEWPQSHVQMEQVASDYKVLAPRRIRITAFAELLVPPFEGAVTAASRAEARRRALLLLLAARRHHLQKGSYPAAIDQIDPKFLSEGWRPDVDGRDPYTGEPLRYVLSDTHLKIYSVGQNKLDDGGQFKSDQGDLPDVGYEVALDAGK